MESMTNPQPTSRLSRHRGPRPWWRLWPGLCVIALLALNLPLAAQETRWYKIEMILFTELGATARDAEYWPQDPGQPQMLNAVPLAVGSARVQSLPPSAYRLSGIWSVLKRSRGYRPIRHLAWQQPGLPSRSAPLVAVGDELDAEIQGTIKVSLARFLHLDLDLILHQEDQRFRLKSSRRMRSNELNYLDHPRFGAIVIITPVTE